MAVMNVLQKEAGLDLARSCLCVAGHSLGEYSALTAAGTFALADTARLLKLRGQSMQRAVPLGQGAMAAIIGLSFDDVMKIAEEVSGAEICTAANDNAPGQVVISGHKAAVAAAMAKATEKGAKRAIELPVSAPFHCALMEPAAAVMAKALADTAMAAPAVPVIANVTAASETDPDTIRRLLVEQVTGRVRWRESVQAMKAMGIDQAVEIGAGKVLSGLIRRIEPDIATSAVGTPEQLEALIKTLS
jgi:[acyl-carrier-protein] S-malonyltransferase